MGIIIAIRLIAAPETTGRYCHNIYKTSINYKFDGLTNCYNLWRNSDYVEIIIGCMAVQAPDQLKQGEATEMKTWLQRLV